MYPRAVRSKSAPTDGVVACVRVGVSMIWMNEPEGARPWEMDERRLCREILGRRDELLVIDGRRCGERGAGEPGWTCAAQETMVEKEEGAGGEGRGPGGAGRGAVGVGRFFCVGGGGFARKGNCGTL